MALRLRSAANTFDGSDDSCESDSEEEIDMNSNCDSNNEGIDADQKDFDDADDLYKEEENNYIIHSDDDKSSDEGPDDIGFNVSKNEALKNIQQAITLLKNDKVSKKNKRKQKEELFQMQKKKKLAEMEKNKLSEDILEAVSGKSFKATKQTNFEEEKTKNSRIRFEEDELFDNEPVVESEEFIPLNSSKGLVVKSVQSKKKPSHKAKDFRDNMLYGNRIKRVDAQTLERQKAKRRARYV
ncbi:hypothetical protein LOTGIDRAFT_231047 [Lottia gigantea]|uniref:Uncharacterized protein n=1 Tax=Lottia gigantea TaxID=225164 RepID=V4A639_LOTGI|nr:hypothetical protein LOTGIDRAFT_231047 [Lottia gigantea]ESO99353.1 hypothetical protein LOTGIDRAFT_231047 [Lottia gigantea]